MENNFSLKDFISYLQATNEDDWQMDVVRSNDQTKNCLFGHLFNYGKDEDESNLLWDWFECEVATTYMVFPVNDGKNPKYQQPTPKQRCIAYLTDILEGREENTMQCMDRCMKEYHAAREKYNVKE